MVGSPGEHTGDVPGTDAEITSTLHDLVSAFGQARVMAVVDDYLQLSARHNSTACLRIAQVIIREIAHAKSSKLNAEVMALGSGIILQQGDNVTKIAKKHGLTKAAISKRVIKFCEENGLPPSIFMRSEKDRATYARTNQPRTS